MSKVRVVAVYRVSSSGEVEQVAGAERRGKKKRKSSRGMRGPERIQRRVLEALDTFASESLDRHNRSSRRKRDGWIRRMPQDRWKASRKALKKLRKVSPF